MFHSTRGKQKVGSAEAIVRGLAEDGGLYVIDQLPRIDYHDMLNDDYKTMASKILNAFFPEFSIEEIYKEVADAYQSFDIEEVVELHSCGAVSFLELFHGPTLAFKDLALVVLPRLMKLSRKKLDMEQPLTILTATSGDTGGAALNGFSDIEGISIVVLYPNGGVSPIQEAQMCSFEGKNAKVIALEGNFDDCQNFVKQFFKEHKELTLSSANSINIARLIPQVVYYFYTYVKMLKSGQIIDQEKINFSVPTGNFGNIFAAFYAKKLGLPIQTLICASNANDVLTEYFLSGKYHKHRPFYKTNSPSMDIVISSNLERLLYYACEEDTNQCKQLMEEYLATGQYEFTNPFSSFYASSCDEESTKKMIKDIYDQYHYLVDPHTAVAYHAYINYVKSHQDTAKTVVVSTASPYKFPQSVLEAFGIEEVDASKAVQLLQKTFDVAIPKVLNYPDFDRCVVSLEEADAYVKGVIQCFK